MEADAPRHVPHTGGLSDAFERSESAAEDQGAGTFYLPQAGSFVLGTTGLEVARGGVRGRAGVADNL